MQRLALGLAFALALVATPARADEPAPTPPLITTPAEAPLPPPAELPPAPPMPTAVEVLAVPGICGTCRPSDCWWTVEIQGHLGLLSPGPEGPVTLDSGLPDQVTWDPIDYGTAGGGRLEVSHALGAWIMNLGATFWGQWQDTALTSGRLAAGSPLSVSSPFANVGLTAEATLWGVDAALWKTRCVSPCLFTGWGLGLRAMSFEEQGDLAVPPPTAGPIAIAHMDADNCLIAAQLLAQVQWKLSARWDLRVRGAGFVGWLHKETEVTTQDFFGVGTQVPQTNEDDTVGYGGEVEISLGFTVRRGWTLRAGYGLLALGNVTRLDEASDFGSVVATGLIGARQGDDLLLAHRFFVGLSLDL